MKAKWTKKKFAKGYQFIYKIIVSYWLVKNFENLFNDLKALRIYLYKEIQIYFCEDLKKSNYTSGNRHINK